MGNSPSSFYVNGHKCSNIHVSCASDDYEPNTDYVGLIFFHKNGQTDIYFGGKHLKIGYLVIAKSSKLSSYNSGEGQVHGNCFKVRALLPKRNNDSLPPISILFTLKCTYSYSFAMYSIISTFLEVTKVSAKK